MRLLRALISPLLKIYVTVAFVIAAVFSPPALAFIPALLAVLYLFLWWRPLHFAVNLITDYFAFFAIPVLLSQTIPGNLVWLASLPLLFLITRDLETAAESATYQPGSRVRTLTRTGIALPFIAVMAVVLSLVFNALFLLFTALVAVAYLGTLYVLILRQMPLQPVVGEVVEERVVAGSKTEVSLQLTVKTGVKGTVFMEPGFAWVKIRPDVVSLTGQPMSVTMSLTPPLSGPSVIPVKCYAIDRWGLIQTQFSLELVRLHVVPRARYAVWLAKRYLAEARSGTLPLLSNVASVRSLYGLRSGIEYYGSQLYQPGDSLKNIDWKHSIKYNKLISKEFAELRGQPAILLVNLAVGDAEEQDKQSYNIVMAALSLAREQIPTALAVYDEEAVRLVTPTLQAQVLVARSMDVIKDVKIIGKPTRYLQPPDVVRLRANIRRLQSVNSDPARALAQLLQVEYQSLKSGAVGHPVAKALMSAFEKTGNQASVVVISPLNHDAEAVMFNTVIYERKGNAVLVV